MIARWHACSKIMRPSSGVASATPNGGHVRKFPVSRAVFSAIAGAGFVTFAFSLDILWPTAWPNPSLRLSIEVVLLVVLVLAFPASRRRSAAWMGLLALLAALWAVLRYVDVGSHSLFGRGIDLYWDAIHAPALFGMLRETMGSGGIWILAGALPAGFAVLWLAMRLALGGIARAADIGPLRRVTLALSSTLTLCYGAGMLSDRIGSEHWFAVPVSVAWAGKLVGAAHAAAEMRADAPNSFDAVEPLADGAGRAIRPLDIVVLFQESMGAASYGDPALASVLAPWRDRLAQAAGGQGWHAASAFVEAATFGGGSWLAHASLLSGAPIEGEGAYRRLLASDRPALTHRLKDAGWRTIGVMPGIKRFWPEGSYWGYDRLMAADDFVYAGPRFGFWEIPDQAAMQQLLAEELAPRQRAPVLAVFPTIMSHYPFFTIPSYSANWGTVRDDNGLTDAPPVLNAETLAHAGLSGYRAGYAHAQAYNLAWLAGALAQPELANAAILALGDHQPPALVAGPPEKIGRLVPVTLFVRNPALLQPFIAEGFAPGLEPGRSALHQADLGHLLLTLSFPESGS